MHVSPRWPMPGTLAADATAAGCGIASGATLRPAADAARMACAMCTGADPDGDSLLQHLLPAGQSRFIEQTRSFAVFPTLGCFRPGYVLVVPRAHVLSFGQLPEDVLREADEVIDAVAGRLARAYSHPVLGFEYGNNMPGGRRIEHAHWHLLPSDADLAGWLAARHAGYGIRSLTGLPVSAGMSYAAIRNQAGQLTCFPVPSQVPQVVRLRRLVAELDSQVRTADWDWAVAHHAGLIRQTVTDLTGRPGADRA